MIVSTKGGKWGLPKGNLMNKLGPEEQLSKRPMKRLEFLEPLWIKKLSKKVRGKKMAFYPMEVKNEFSVWPESEWRKRKWIRSNEATNYLSSNSLRSLLAEVSENILQTCS